MAGGVSGEESQETGWLVGSTERRGRGRGGWWGQRRGEAGDGVLGVVSKEKRQGTEWWVGSGTSLGDRRKLPPSWALVFSFANGDNAGGYLVCAEIQSPRDTASLSATMGAEIGKRSISMPGRYRRAAGESRGVHVWAGRPARPREKHHMLFCQDHFEK